MWRWKVWGAVRIPLVITTPSLFPLGFGKKNISCNTITEFIQIFTVQKANVGCFGGGMCKDSKSFEMWEGSKFCVATSRKLAQSPHSQPQSSACAYHCSVFSGQSQPCNLIICILTAYPHRLYFIIIQRKQKVNCTV